MKEKIKAHLFTLPRWFAAPFFGCSLLMGAVLAGGLGANAWIALVGGLLIMAGGHSFNSFLDYAWTGLDKGEVGERSAEKDYAGGQSIIALGIVSEREVLFNAISWYILALAPLIYLAINVSWIILPLAIAGMLITFWYACGKFNWTHETALAAGVGPIAVLLGMFSVNPSPPCRGQPKEGSQEPSLQGVAIWHKPGVVYYVLVPVRVRLPSFSNRNRYPIPNDRAYLFNLPRLNCLSGDAKSELQEGGRLPCYSSCSLPRITLGRSVNRRLV